MSGYTPTTEEVRGDYANFQLPAGGGDFRGEYAEGLAEFDRWLAAHDAAALAALADKYRAFAESATEPLIRLQFQTTADLLQAEVTALAEPDTERGDAS